MRIRFLPLMIAGAMAVGAWATWIANDGRGLFAGREQPPDFDAVLKKLAEPTSLAVEDMPLRELVAQLSVRHGLDIQIDFAALSDLDLTAGAKVTFRADGISLRFAMRNCLRLVHSDLVAVVQGETLVVTSRDVGLGSPEHFVGRVYTVSPLLAAREPVSELALADIVQKTIQPESWEEAGGKGVLKLLPGGLAVAHTLEVHAEIEQLLRQLERVGEQHDDFTPIWVTTLGRAAGDKIARLYPVGDLISGPDADPYAPYDKLIAIIRSAVTQRRWNHDGDTQEMYGIAGALLILLPDDDHRKVEQLLSNLRSLLDPSAQPPSGPIGPPVTRAEQVLAERSGIRARGTPLVDVVDYLRQRHEIDIVIHRRGVSRRGLIPEVPITLKMEDARLDLLLRTMLEPLDLIVVAEDDQLRITSSDTVPLHPSTLHNVRHLIDPDLGITDTDCLRKLIAEMTDPVIWDSWSGHADMRFFRGMLVISQAGSADGETTSLLDALTRYQRDYGSLRPVSAIPPDRKEGASLYTALLNRQVSFDLPRMPLDGAARALSHELELPIQLDETALEFWEMPTDVLVNPRARRMTCGAALESFVEHLGLSCEVRGDKILFTAQRDPPRASEYCRIYPVRDLVYFPSTVPDVPPGTGGLHTAEWDEHARGFGPPALDYKSLIELVEITVYAANRRGERGAGPMEYCEGALVIRQTWRAHRETERLLAQLRHAFWPELYPEPGLSPVEVALQRPASVRATAETVDGLLDRVAREYDITILTDARSRNVLFRPRNVWRTISATARRIGFGQVADVFMPSPPNDDDPFAGLDDITSDIDQLLKSLAADSADSSTDQESGRDAGNGVYDSAASLSLNASELLETLRPVARMATRGGRWLLDRWQLELHLGHVAVDGESHDVPLGTGLRSILRPLDLDVCVYDDALSVGAYLPERLPRITRVYNVRDLVAKKEFRSQLTTPVDRESDPFRFPDQRFQRGFQGPFGGTGYDVFVPPLKPLEYGFCDVVVRNVFPQSWRGHGGRGRAVLYQGTLVVVQSWSIHCEVQQLLRDLRNAARALPATDRLRDGVPSNDFEGLLRTALETQDSRLQAYLCYLIEQTDIPAADALPGLLQSLRQIAPETDAVMHDMLCRFIARYGAEADSAVPLLADQLDGPMDRERRAVAIATLSRLGASAVPTLSKCLAKHDDGQSREDIETWHLLAALYHCMDPETADIESLLKLLVRSDSHPARLITKILTTVDKKGDRCREIINQWKKGPDETRRLGEEAERLLQGFFEDPAH